jgi:hypothetical protein
MVGKDSSVVTRGTAPCTLSDGVNTVRFSNGAVYTGRFVNCRPVSGPGKYVYQGQTFEGHFEAMDNGSVRYATSEYEIVIQVGSGH